LEADYYFNITPTAVVTALAGKVYIAFPAALSPKLNREGRLTCTMNDTAAYCDFYSARFIRLWPHTDIPLTDKTRIGVFHVS